MPIDFSKFQKNVPDKEISPDSQDEKITPEENDQKSAASQTEKKVLKSNFIVEKLPGEKKTKTEKNVDPHQIDAQIIDQKINELINERLLKLVKLGLKHELTFENMMQYFREVDKAKLYELKRFFSDSPGYKIEKMLKFLYTSGELKKDKDNWYSLK